MALPDVSSGALSGAIKEFVPKTFNYLFNTMSKVMKSGAIKYEDTEGKDWTATVIPPCTGDVMWSADFANWPTGEAQLPTKMRLPPKLLVAKVRLGAQASEDELSVTGKAMYVESQIKARLVQMASNLARGMFTSGGVSPVAAGLGAWTSTAANGTATMSFNDVSLFREGAAYDYLPNVGLSYVVRVQSITRATVGANSANVAGTVVFINDVVNPATGAITPLAATTTAITDQFRQRGYSAGFGGAATALNRVINSYNDFAGTGLVQGFSAATLPGWAGSTITTGATFTQEQVHALAGRIEAVSGEAPTQYFCSPALLRAFGASFQVQGGFGLAIAASAATPRGVSATADKFGSSTAYECEGKPLIADINCEATTIVCHNENHVKLARFSEIKVLGNNGDEGTSFLDQQVIARNFFLKGAYEL